MKKYLKLFFVYYTFRAIGLHILYFAGILPNTWIVAIFVFLVSQFFLFVYPNLIKKYGPNKIKRTHELVNHRLPIFIVPYHLSIEGVWILLGSLALYILIHRSKIITYYSDPHKVVHNILTSK